MTDLEFINDINDLMCQVFAEAGKDRPDPAAISRLHGELDVLCAKRRRIEDESATRGQAP